MITSITLLFFLTLQRNLLWFSCKNSKDCHYKIDISRCLLPCKIIQLLFNYKIFIARKEWFCWKF